MATDESTLGRDVAQVNARAKVLGRAQYAGDIQLPGMLHGKVLRSPYPHARIVRIDTSRAEQLPGVKAVLTGANSPATPWGVHHKDRRTLALDVVRFAGQEVAAVAASTEDTARDALDLIDIEYEELAPLLTVDEALAPGAAEVHAGHSNLVHEIAFDRGDVDAGFASAHLVHEATYATHPQYPGYMEPMASVATVDADGRLQVWTATQSAFLVRDRLAKVLQMPASRIRVIQATTGGGFGGKIIEDANSLIAAMLALAARRPVRLVNNRLEDFLACPTSLPERITLKLGMDEGGRIVAKQVDIVADCGAFSGLTPEIMHVSAMRSDNMHRNRNVRSRARLVYTHTPPHGAFRGFGGTQMLFALNSHIDTMARQLGLDPVEVHRRNAIEAGETSVHGWKIGSTGLQQCLSQCVEALDWSAKRARAASSGRLRRGVGVAAAMHVSGNRTIGNWDGSTVMLKVNEDGRVIVHSSEADVGQGAMTMLAQIVAHELNIPLAHVHVALPDTDHSPYCIGTLASRVTIVAGNAAIVAARAAREKLFALASTKLDVPVEQLEIREGCVMVQGAAERRLTLAALAREHIWRHGGHEILVTGSWDAKTQMHDKLMGNVAPAYSFAAQAVEVEVDTETGQVRLVDSFVADDCGKALNPVAVHGQSNGAAAQAIGWALYEQLKLEDGRIANGNFADYTMPTPDSLPALRSGIVESNDPNGPYGAKGASECAILPGAPAIANAVFDAVGVRITELPITPEKVLAGLRALREQKEGAGHA
ncbi:xanthine dehydrogenase family protein molybdopterin-binding subunit [Ramlibacter rhizophilus]|uniref:Xanthine dehydrogenase family protein molybdopterin-binding subunit n=1 Tax=Ramlibacter rhizophilus TaxID=1781167 RepID=A0A4Z0BH74_9BURK|nr:xanthine dehydrogenase family protein molybdopterin-binding subunit [Ramlibacter rhizophilus]TFY97258.1 xanthine dehydrogenase family protein molybdopterin-binding subunit [Ramlibacter rhizophilus]